MKISGQGNLTNKPIITKITNHASTRVCEFRMRLQSFARRKSDAPDWSSLNDEQKREDRAARDRGLWLSVSIWDERFIDPIFDNLDKGSPVYLEGDMEARPFRRDDGTNDLSYDVRATLVLPWLPYVDGVSFKRSTHQSEKNNGDRDSA